MTVYKASGTGRRANEGKNKFSSNRKHRGSLVSEALKAPEGPRQMSVGKPGDRLHRPAK